MRSPAHRAAVAVALAAVAPSAEAQQHSQPVSLHRACARRSTIRNYETWIRSHARHGRIAQRDKPRMWTLERCQAHRQPARLAGIRWRIHYLRAQAYDLAHPLVDAVASWYIAAGGPIACGGDSYALGVASRTLACGTRLQICYRTCTDAIVFDRGPFIYSRSLDLSGAVKSAIGFPDGVATVRYRVLP